jgi:hypothetical protein
MQLSYIELLHVSVPILHKIKITKQKPREGLHNQCLPCSEGEMVV